MNKRCPVCGGPIHNGIEHVPDNCIDFLLDKNQKLIALNITLFEMYAKVCVYNDIDNDSFCYKLGAKCNIPKCPMIG